MPVETASSFAKVIQDHLELKERNSGLDDSMPLGNYKTEEQARLEETMDGQEPVVADRPTVLAWPGEETEEHPGPEVEGHLWSKSRDFDWGD